MSQQWIPWPSGSDRYPLPEQRVQDWLFYPSSITQRFRQYSQQNAQQIFHMVRDERLCRIYADEASMLGVKIDDYCRVREIEWRCHQQVWIYGRVVIPHQTLQSHDGLLRSLGHRSLGDILFHSPLSNRSVLEIGQLNSLHPYFQAACIDFLVKPNALWARRSLWWIDQFPLLVIEIFLPELFNQHIE